MNDKTAKSVLKFIIGQSSIFCHETIQVQIGVKLPMYYVLLYIKTFSFFLIVLELHLDV